MFLTDQINRTFMTNRFIYALKKISQLHYRKCPAAKWLGKPRKKMFKPLVKKRFPVNCITIFRKKRGGGNKVKVTGFAR